MADSADSTPQGAAEPSVSALHDRWRRILNEIDTSPGPPDARRLRRLEAAEAIERDVVKTRARDVTDIIIKLRMIQSSRVCSLSEGGLLGSALSDLERMRQEKPSVD